jgi:hypothetical protein
VLSVVLCGIGRATRLTPILLLVLAFAGCDDGGGDARAPTTVFKTAPVTVTAPVETSNGRPRVETRRIDRFLSLRNGELGRTLYAVRGDYGRVGTFVVGCADDGTPTSTSFRVPATRANVDVAVDGRGVSAAKRVFPGDELSGGDGPGLEHWYASMGIEPEAVGVDAALAAFGRSKGDPGCTFRLRVTVQVTPNS